jgi:hypothetical protein
MNELEMRVFIRQIIEVLRKGATLTGVAIDDQVCDMVLKAVDSDLLWSWVWSLIGRFVNDTEPIVVSESYELTAACEVEAINPLMIIAIIKAIVELWKQLRPQ